MCRLAIPPAATRQRGGPNISDGKINSRLDNLQAAILNVKNSAISSRFVTTMSIPPPTAINYPRALPFYDAYAHLGHEPADFPIAHRHATEILSLPMHPYLERTDIKRVADAIRAHKSA